MSKFIKLIVRTPQKTFYNGEIKELMTETIEGRRSILPDHAPLIAILRPNITTIIGVNGEEKNFFCSSGVLRVNKDETVILCDAAEWPSEIDEERAENSLERAKQRLTKEERIDKERAELALKRAINRIRASKIK
ncbi:ATP synthase epsilon chain [Clostridium homopropionicum DSM 5847]|uniref:ATP synthase epsilon chain n=1 Tax=Clostridium homopropionicum DSM 5847 TaxID=1121318 RepID=A0A0L6Z5V6_9CLOT|nr:F0F1 ATP synthase subunit epsilon [Clostridium homopropionicum]KOA18352.1 ATP synthase epsilon chain [Clostridium homopropionicum DSM 5847]SFF68607.1 F-type H+-transporting ATPase subunit epsilon [Clostridium homopropionicum]